MAQLYADEDFPYPTVDALQQMGHDVVTALQSERANQAIPDGEVLAYAAAQGRDVVTLNRRDFIRLHQENPHHAGIIVCSHDLNFVALAQRIHETLQAAPDLANRLWRVNRPD